MVVVVVGHSEGLNDGLVEKALNVSLVVEMALRLGMGIFNVVLDVEDVLGPEGDALSIWLHLVECFSHSASVVEEEPAVDE